MNENVRLKNISKGDIDFLYSLLKERLNYSKDLDFIHPSDFPSYEKHVEIIENYLTDTKNTFDRFYKIQFKENDIWIDVGSIVLKKDYEWGYHILKKYWNQGIGSKTINQFFEIHKDKRIICKIKPENERAIHIMKKLGFKLTELTFVKQSQN